MWSMCASSLSFFIITNLGVWLFQDLYPMTWPGLMTCFAAAIPFFGNQILGDLFYSAAHFGTLALAGEMNYRFQVRKL